MASITIRNLDDAVKSALRIRAARHGQSMEEEARSILRDAVTGEITPQLNLAQAIRRHIAPLGGIELTLPKRNAVRRPPKLSQ